MLYNLFRLHLPFLLLLFFPLFQILAQVKRPDIIGIATVEIQVTDIPTTKKFYEGLLGYTGTTVTARGNKQPALLLRINQRQSILLHGGLPATQIERLVAVGLQTTDAAAMLAYLKGKGVTVPDTLTRETGSVSFTVQDPEKHLIKFIQYFTGKEMPGKTTNTAISNRILHAGISISNLPLSDAFYKDILGFSEIWRGGTTDSATSWINMRLPESTDYIEYMLTNTTPNKQQLGSMHHIALLVPDMQQAVDILRPRAVKTEYNMAAPRIGRNNKWQLNLYDADGTRVELMEPFTFR